jgi:hypothetical protein
LASAPRGCKIGDIILRLDVNSRPVAGQRDSTATLSLFRLQIPLTSPPDSLLVFHTAPRVPGWRVAGATKRPHLSSIPRELRNRASAGLRQLSDAENVPALDADNAECFTRGGREGDESGKSRDHSHVQSLSPGRWAARRSPTMRGTKAIVNHPRALLLATVTRDTTHHDYLRASTGGAGSRHIQKHHPTGHTIGSALRHADGRWGVLD